MYYKHDFSFLKDHNKLSNFSLIFLNTIIPAFFISFLKNANYKICADGGANRFYEFFKKHNFLPDYIIGDLDSINNEVELFYKNKAKFIIDKNQDNNDLFKCLKFYKNLNIKNKIIVTGEFGNRLDHLMANINTTLFFLKEDIIFLSEKNCYFCLKPGEHEIRFDSTENILNCGLIPIFKKCKNVLTQGLKWNLKNQPLEFGNLISSSNKILAKEIFITVSHPILFTFNFL